jgi:peptidyl-prolyl cis-trans isomerase C
MDPATKPEKLLGFLINLRIAAKAADDQKLGDSDEFKKSVAFARERLLMNKLLASEAKAATTDAALHKTYDELVKQTGNIEEIHARHILVETEDQAKKIKEELKRGADFAELAKKESKDSTASDGGDLNFFAKKEMETEISDVAFALEPGKISDPVRTKYGWHIIKVEEKRIRPVPAFEQVKGSIEEFVATNAQRALLDKLRGEAKIEFPGAPKESAK